VLMNEAEGDELAIGTPMIAPSRRHSDEHAVAPQAIEDLRPIGNMI